MTDYRDKVRKLLALAESPNEAEARAALLKARQLMAEHKLTERDVRETECQKVVRVLTDVTCSKRRDPWCIPLSAVIGENYCCKAIRNHRKGQQTQTCGFLGFEDDTAICSEIFKYAVDCVRSELKEIRRQFASFDGTTIKYQCDSFGYGFVAGVKQMFNEQNREHQQWGLVLVIPQDVLDAANELGKPSEFRSRSQDSLLRTGYNEGYKRGCEFQPRRRLAAQELGIATA